ncbi:MAG TPA: triose-phosphate isomerase [Tissierellales bacterium]|nr:triose-phosphate isomerase [Tissierellales bacterium]
MRTPMIAGNWKMNKTLDEALELVKDIKNEERDKDVEAVLCIPYVNLTEVKKLIEDTDIKLGAQNVHWEDSGAYTGEISPLMLKNIGVEYVIIGHSERRQYFNETDEIVNKKVKAVLNHGLKPILCVGETLAEREKGIEEDIVGEQIKNALEGISEEDASNIVIAYEPIWAIGTGKTASSKDANTMLGFIRNILGDIYNKDLKNNIRILYGGSVKPANIKELMAEDEIDGALVGGASLKKDDFLSLINY